MFISIYENYYRIQMVEKPQKPLILKNGHLGSGVVTVK